MADESPSRQEVLEAKTQLEGVMADAKRQLATMIKAGREQHAYAKEQQVRWDKERRALAAFKDDPKKPEHNTYASVDLLFQSYVHLQKMRELEIGAWEHNIGLIDAGVVGGFKVPQQGADHREHKCRFDLAINRYLVRFNIVGIDTLLRAAGKAPAINPVTVVQKRERETAGQAIADAAKVSPAAAQIVDQLGADLFTIRELNRWGIDSLARWDSLSPAARQGLLEHPDWAAIDGYAPLLQKLHERCANVPALQKLFTPWRPERAFGNIQPEGSRAPVAPKNARGTDTLSFNSGKSSSLKLP